MAGELVARTCNFWYAYNKVFLSSFKLLPANIAKKTEAFSPADRLVSPLPITKEISAGPAESLFIPLLSDSNFSALVKPSYIPQYSSPGL